MRMTICLPLWYIQTFLAVCVFLLAKLDDQDISTDQDWDPIKPVYFRHHFMCPSHDILFPARKF